MSDAPQEAASAETLSANLLSQAVEAHGGALENSGGERELILVVDDEPQVLFLNTMLLVSHGFRVMQFASPDCALVRPTGGCMPMWIWQFWTLRCRAWTKKSCFER